MKLSLWLLPPEPLFTRLQDQINAINVESKGHCPTFLPHVTVLGGMDCNLNDHDNDVDDAISHNANNLLQRFRNDLEGFGAVPCHFIPLSQVKDNTVRKRNGNVITVYSHSDDDDGEGGQKIQWNQCSVMIMKRCMKFLDLIHLSYRIFEPFLVTPTREEEEDYFKPPLCEPHYSFTYGTDQEILNDLCHNHIKADVLKDFDSTEAVLMITDPPTLEGARSQWREIGRINLRFF